MPTIAEVRQKYPQYSDMSDEQLANALYSKFYSDMPQEEFNAKIGLAQKPLSASDVAVGAVKNLPQSALQFGKNLIQPIIHPIETAQAIGDIGQGALQKAGIISGEEKIPQVNALGQFFANRYGGAENIKRTLATDPVGTLADLSMVLSGGGGLAARAPGIAGRLGEITQAAGRATNPLAPVAAGTKAIGNIASEAIGGMGTGTGGEAIKLAAKSGFEGGAPAQAFRENMRGQVPMAGVVEDAQNAVNNMRQQRGADYLAGMKGVAADQQVLPFQAIDNALQKAQLIKTYKGQNLSPATEAIATKLQDTVNDWRSLNPQDFHTAEGLDALKQKIGSIRDATTYGTPERVAADKVYHAVRNTIVQQAPEYAKVMKGYEEASDLIKEMQKTLSLNPNASVDTSLRKLQSVLRNNVNTNYGNRAKLVDYLSTVGAPELRQALAGQALNAWMPRGLNRVGAQIGMELLLAGLGTATAGGGAGLAAAGAALPLMSPRLVGEAAYLGGKTARYLPPGKSAGSKLFQIGRASEAQ